MNKKVLDLSSLTEFVLHSLRSTDDVKNILRSQCEEVKFVLAPWNLETIEKRQIDQESCKCLGIPSLEDHVNEIATGIDRAVAQARQLREKLAINVLAEKKLARKPSVSQIYASGSRVTASKTRLSDSKGGKENGCKPSSDTNKRAVTEQCDIGIRQREPEEVKSNDTYCPKKKIPVKNQFEVPKALNEKDMRTKVSKGDKKSFTETCQLGRNRTRISESKQIDEKLISTSPYNLLAAASKADRTSKGKKNFIAANKSRIKNMEATNTRSQAVAKRSSSSSEKLIHSSHSLATEKSSDSSISGPTSAAELEKLISKLSVDSDTRLSGPNENSEAANCPVHDKNAPKYVEEKIYTSMDVTEGLDRFGVPSDLVKLLKVYHGYFNRQSTSKMANDKRGEKAEHRFLTEFHTMNHDREKLSTRRKLDNLCKDFLPMLKESCNKSMDFIELSQIKIRYTNLDTTCKLLEIRNFSPLKRKVCNMMQNRCTKSLIERNRTWRLNAVWNEACIPNFKEMSRVCYIRYANKNQLLVLFELMQRIQQLKYQATLVNLLNSEVVPSIRDTLEPNSEEYVEAYKMISIISNLLHQTVPVLVRTDQ
ncbi:uncharacterized protein [Neodiprion pinetum]|uniref:uncharacterized protein isoform X1 n=1 Tax=Neodiprion pinetum TaxID=441929 RepID=UPI001EDFEFCE|nr:uncharacterized protein LOC124219024 isoform X1 [Neodiprion pinetum]XP_046482050.1 uncharacterized protein LOC124219024 isoform X1 [Neodiprion pinetum]